MGARRAPKRPVAASMRRAANPVDCGDSAQVEHDERRAGRQRGPQSQGATLHGHDCDQQQNGFDNDDATGATGYHGGAFPPAAHQEFSMRCAAMQLSNIYTP